VVVFTGEDQLIAFYRQLTNAASTTFKATFNDVEAPEAVKETLGSEIANYYFATPTLPLNSSNKLVDQYKEELEAAAANGNEDAQAALDQERSTYVISWLSLWVIEQLVKSGEVEELTAAGVMSALKSAKNINMDGIMPPWTPNAPGPKGQERLSNPYFYIAKYNSDAEPEVITKKPITIEEAMKGEF
jgi:hypothetical protein